jgi:hypothetical protein
MIMRRLIIVSVLLVILPVVLIAQMPISQEAKLITTTAAGELEIEASGIYRSPAPSSSDRMSDIRRQGEARATEDAKRAAVYFAIFSGPNPILKTADERRSLEEMANSFFSMSNINSFVTYESNILTSQYINKDAGMRISKLIRVNPSRLEENLRSLRVVDRTSEITASIGNPEILILPKVQPGQNAQTYANVGRNSDVNNIIERYLTRRQFKVKIPQQAEVGRALTDTQLMLMGRNDDYAYKLALVIGADIYFEYDYNNSGGQHNIAIRVMIAATGDAQGTEIARGSNLETVVEEALSLALKSTMAYWATVAQKGAPFRLTIKTNGHDRDDVVDGLSDVFKGLVKERRVIQSTPETVEYFISVDRSQWEDYEDFGRELRRKFRSTSNLRLSTLTTTRSLILYEVN